MGWQIHQMDVKTTFLNRVIEKEVCVEQSQGLEVLGQETHVCRLRQALYGLKQAPRVWYLRIDTYLQQMGFTKTDADPNLYYIVVGDVPLILVLYVDDLFITRAEKLISGCKDDLAMEFEMKVIGLMHYFLGLEVWQEEGHIFLGQGQYVVDALSRFHMADCRPMSTPMITNWKKLHASDSSLVDPTLYRQLIGSLVYLVNTRPGYTDSDWAGCASNRKSTSGCCFGLGLEVVSWFNRKQKSVALSSSEAEYMAASQTSCEAIWLRKLLYGLFDQELRPMVIHCDNQSCIKLTENPVFHDRSKHIDIRYHFIRDYVQKRAVKLEYTSTDEQMPDVLTKSLKAYPFRGQDGCGEKHFPR
eukprot:PITA_32245